VLLGGVVRLGGITINDAKREERVVGENGKNEK
jgi:hypothetical protein